MRFTSIADFSEFAEIRRTRPLRGGWRWGLPSQRGGRSLGIFLLPEGLSANRGAFPMPPIWRWRRRAPSLHVGGRLRRICAAPIGNLAESWIWRPSASAYWGRVDGYKRFLRIPRNSEKWPLIGDGLRDIRPSRSARGCAEYAPTPKNSRRVGGHRNRAIYFRFGAIPDVSPTWRAPTVRFRCAPRARRAGTDPCWGSAFLHPGSPLGIADWAQRSGPNPAVRKPAE